MITLSNVSVGYGKKSIIKNASFVAESAQITVILGKNGSGKSTLLKAISGILPYSGSITADDREISETKAAMRAKMISVMPQMLHAPAVTVREFVSYGRQPYTGGLGVLSKDDWNIVESALTQADVMSLAGRYVNQISGGERQRTYFAMLLAQNTNNILLDEPGAHLDAQHNKQLSDFLKSMSSSKKTVIAILHDINQATRIADRIVFVDSGSVIFCGHSEDFENSGIPQSVLGLKKIECVKESGKKYVFI